MRSIIQMPPDTRETVIEGKTVLVGDTAAVEQTEHQRGRPYIWNSSTVHYVIVTDDEAWAAKSTSFAQLTMTNAY